MALDKVFISSKPWLISSIKQKYSLLSIAYCVSSLLPSSPHIIESYVSHYGTSKQFMKQHSLDIQQVSMRWVSGMNGCMRSDWWKGNCLPFTLIHVHTWIWITWISTQVHDFLTKETKLLAWLSDIVLGIRHVLVNPHESYFLAGIKISVKISFLETRTIVVEKMLA